MAFIPRIVLLLVFSVFYSALTPSPGLAYDEADRTANRSIFGQNSFICPWIFTRPEHYEFTPLVSNQDPQNQHPAAWEGQDWEITQWNRQWTPERAIEEFLKARIFEGWAKQGSSSAAVILGPTFYKLSDLDRRRALRLLTDQTAVFKEGHRAVKLLDWSTRDAVGVYTPQGLFLN